MVPSNAIKTISKEEERVTGEKEKGAHQSFGTFDLNKQKAEPKDHPQISFMAKYRATGIIKKKTV